MRHFYKVEDSQVVINLDKITMSAKLSEGTLLYAWGNASYGKLGLGLSKKAQFDELSDFVREDLSAPLENEDLRGLSHYYAYRPQPVVSLLGHRIREVACGQQHCIALTSSGDLYAWGDNSKYQLGLDSQDLQAAQPLIHLDTLTISNTLLSPLDDPSTVLSARTEQNDNA